MLEKVSLFDFFNFVEYLINLIILDKLRHMYPSKHGDTQFYQMLERFAKPQIRVNTRTGSYIAILQFPISDLVCLVPPSVLVPKDPTYICSCTPGTWGPTLIHTGTPGKAAPSGVLIIESPSMCISRKNSFPTGTVKLSMMTPKFLLRMPWFFTYTRWMLLEDVTGQMYNLSLSTKNFVCSRGCYTILWIPWEMGVRKNIHLLQFWILWKCLKYEVMNKKCKTTRIELNLYNMWKKLEN